MEHPWNEGSGRGGKRQIKRGYCLREENFAINMELLHEGIRKGQLDTDKIRKYFLPPQKQQTLSTKLLQSCVSIYFEIMHGL